MPIVISAHTTLARSGLLHTGTPGDDFFVPTEQVDTFVGGGGNDVVSYTDSPVGLVIEGKDGFAILGLDARTLDRFEGISTLIGTEHNDFITTGDFHGREANIHGGGGADIIGLRIDNATVFGGQGGDFLEPKGQNNHVYGGEGDDFFPTYGTNSGSFFGGSGRDLFEIGTIVRQFIDAGADDDFVRAASSTAELLVYGGDGSDQVEGGQAADAIFGGAGHDSLNGGNGNDILNGGEGNDILFDRQGLNTLNGGAGHDTYLVYDSASGPGGDINRHTIVETLGYSQGGGLDTVISNRDFALPQNVEVLRLINTARIGEGNAAPNVIVASASGSHLIGWGGNDRLVGGVGSDHLSGGAGQDTLVGGGGADFFLFSDIAHSASGTANRDFIIGFVRGEDRISLETLLKDASEPVTFIGINGFSGHAGELRVQGTGGHNAVIVELDSTGNGQANFQILVNGAMTLQESDFLL